MRWPTTKCSEWSTQVHGVVICLLDWLCGILASIYPSVSLSFCLSVSLSGIQRGKQHCHQTACSVSSADRLNVMELLTYENSVQQWVQATGRLSAIYQPLFVLPLSLQPSVWAPTLSLLSSQCLQSQACIIHYENWRGINDVGFHTNTHTQTCPVTKWLQTLFSWRNIWNDEEGDQQDETESCIGCKTTLITTWWIVNTYWKLTT